MGSSSSISGLSSGLDTESIIKGLMSIKRQQVDRLTAKKELEAAKNDTWSTIMSHTVGLQLSAYNLSKTSTFNSRKLTLSDETVANASVYGTATPGSYQFIAHKLATAQQVSSIGFHDYDTTPVGAGTITVELGNGDVKRDTLLNELNGGKGITRGKVKLTDREGATATLDLSYAMTVDDVLKAINTSGIKVSATLNTAGNGFTLTATGGAGTLSAEEVLGGTIAADLGIKGSIVGNTLAGSSVAYLGSSSSLASLNDGLGVSKAGLLINAIAVNLSTANTLGDVVTAINNAATGVTASIRADGKGLRLTSGGAFTVAENGGASASELGILSLVATGDGNDLYAGLNSVLLKNLNGTTGVSGTIFTIQGAANANVDITGLKSLRQVIDAINAQTGTTNVSAQYNAARNGLELYSTTGSAFTVVENTGAPAASLGILGTSSNGVINGGDLDIAWLGKNVALSTLNQGEGVRKGTIIITNKAGATLTVNLTSSTIKTLGDVISTINTQSTNEGKGITVTVNSTGDGLLLTDSSGGAGSLLVNESSNGHMAKDLGILGSSTGTTLNGSFEKSITVSSTYTLKDVQTAINNLGMNINATILNDGSTNPYRLNLSSTKTGSSGRMAIRSSISGLSLTTSVEPQNAAIILGEPTSKNALFIANSTNDVSTLIPGVKLSLKKASTAPVTLSVSTDSDSVVTSVKDFVEKYNKTITSVNEQLRYDSTNKSTGPLFGDSTLMLLQQQIYSTINRNISGLSGSVKTASQVGLNLGLDGKLTFSETTLKTVMETNLNDVVDFFAFQNNLAVTATATASSTTAPWTTAGGHDGNTKIGDYASGATGWQAPNGASYELDFGARKELSSLKVVGVDTLASDILSGYSIEYKVNAADTSWKTYSTLSGNTNKDNSIYFPTGLFATKIRLNNMQSTGGSAKLLDFQTFESTGFAAAYDLSLSKITSGGTGMISSAQDGIDETQQTLDEAIASQEARLVIEEERLRKQFTKLEEMLGQLKNSSSMFDSQIKGINASWGSK